MDGFFGNANSRVFHRGHCEFACLTASGNQECFDTEFAAFDSGYRPCQHCILYEGYGQRVQRVLRTKAYQTARAEAFLRGRGNERGGEPRSRPSARERQTG